MKLKLTWTNLGCVALTIGLVGCASATRYSRSTGEYMDDKTTAKNVKHDLKKDSLTKAADIDVACFRGNVHLTGYVDYPVQKQHAEYIARNAEGVQWLKDDIIVKSQLPSGQAYGSTRMQESAGAQGQNQNQANMQYHQSTTASAGPAQSSSGWIHGNRGFNAVEPASENTGSSSNVQNESAGAQNYSTQGATEGQNAQNTDLAERVRSDIQSDNTLNAQNVQVENKGDKIILHGTVATKEEKEAIEAKAKLIPGVRSVSNKIDVQK